MDPLTLSTALDIVAPALGQTLSVDQKTALETSLTVLQQDQGFHACFFWGRVNGLSADYLIAQGIKFPLKILGASESPETFFFSTDGTKWVLLPAVDAATAARCARISKPFVGDAAITTTLLERKGEGAEAPVEAEDDEEPAPEGFVKSTVTEVERLAFSVKSIMSAAGVIPRGYMILDANDTVVPNRSFRGLSGEDITKPSSFVHWRPTANPKSVVKLGDAASDSLDFLESIADDVPTGCWSMQLNGTSSAMILRHLVWPGAVAFASVGRPLCGYTYFGSGLPNQDIAFML